MGYYIETPKRLGKAEQLKTMYGAEIISKVPTTFGDIPTGKALICVVNNGMFEAAGYIYSEREFSEFSHPDGRHRDWVLMDLEIAQVQSGFKR